MKWGKFIITALVCILVSGCGRAYKDMELTSGRIVSVVPQGLRSVAATVEVGVHNPAGSFFLSDAVATIRLDGHDMLCLNVDQIFVQGHCDKEYTIPLTGNMADGFNPFQLLKLLDGKAVKDNLTVSFSARVSKKGGRGKVIEINDLPISRFIDRL